MPQNPSPSIEPRTPSSDMSHATVNRREFLKTGAAAGASLVIGLYLPTFDPSASHAPAAREPFKPNAWIEIRPDGAVTIWTGRSEMGQGVRTAMPMIVAEELEADWTRVRVAQADADPAYGDQFTVGSRSVRSGFEPLRKAGAAAREMLIGAAALTWNVPREACRARNGMVEHVPTGRRLGYGDLAARAATLPVPADPPLKRPSEFRILGQRVLRVDTPDKVSGAAIFGLDVRVPGMVYAAVARCPVFGGRVKTFDPTPALAVPGVQRVIQISSGVAVVAERTWAAFQGKKALKIEWEEGPSARWGSDGIWSAFAAAAARPGEVVRAVGDVDANLKTAARTVEAVYQAPYLAHACMEPMNCTAHVKDGRCEIWAPTQNPQGVQRVGAQVTGLPVESVTVHVTYLGGGFGRRGGPTDYATEAVELAQKIAGPVQVVWTREDDIQNAVYRPATYNVLRAGLDARGAPVAWSHRLVGPAGGPGARDRAVAVRRDVPVPRGRGVGGAGRRGAGAPRGVRRRLRHPREPRHGRGPAAERDRVRPYRGTVRGDHHRARAGGAEQLHRLSDARARGDAGDRGAPGAERGRAGWRRRGGLAAHRAGGVQRHLRRDRETNSAVTDRAGGVVLTP